MNQRAILLGLLILAVAAARPATAAVEQASGKLTFLRVNDVGGRFGPSDDNIEAEVIVKIANTPGAFGFKLRNDANRPARQGMLDLLRDAFNHQWTVTLDYEIEPGKVHGVIFRVALTR